MIPILYETTETTFTSNGIGRLSDAVSCTVTEERNGVYELKMQYPIVGVYFSELQHSRIIYATPADGKDGQPFRIYRIEKPLDGICTIYAEHISYELNHIPVMPFTASSCVNALNGLVTYSGQTNPFTVWTNKSVSNTFTLREPRTFRELLGGSSGSILDVYGKGEYEFDKYLVKLYVNRGTDSGVTIRYAKNLVDLVNDENIEDVYTGVCPFWASEDGTIVLLPEIALYASTAPNYPYKRTKIVDFSGEWETAPTIAQLRARTQTYIDANNIGIPKVNIEVEFVPLWQTSGASLGSPVVIDDSWTVDGEDYKILERIHLCDTVSIVYSELGVSHTAEVIKTVYNVLLDRYDSIEVGEAKTSLATIVTGIDDTIKAVEAEVSGTDIAQRLMAYVDNQTQLITGGLGGYVRLTYNADGEPQEILVMDTDDASTAVNVIRINQNGIGFSTTGYSGPFTSAWTIDGVFNTAFIGAGAISGTQIDADSISVSHLTSTVKASLVSGVSTVTQYYLSTSDQSAAGGSWSSSIPTWSSGHYIWTRDVTTTTYVDGSTDTAYSPSSAGVYDSNLTEALSTANTAASAASAAQTAANGANYREQLIYKSAVSGTSSMSGTTTWITSTSDVQNAWTTKRPTYSSAYPVLFVATQRQTMAQSGGTTCSCTTPIKDDTTTVIDGGHITTGTMDASLVNVINLNASNIISGTLTSIAINNGNGTFTVDANGNLTASSASITGDITSHELDYSQSPPTAIADRYSTLYGAALVWYYENNPSSIFPSLGYIGFTPDMGTSHDDYLHINYNYDSYGVRLGYYGGSTVPLFTATEGGNTSHVSLTCESGLYVNGQGNVSSLGLRQQLTSGTDLNTVTTPGSYASDSFSNTFSNLPSGCDGAFLLDVENSIGYDDDLSGAWQYVRQIIRPLRSDSSTATQNIYMRELHTDGNGAATAESWYTYVGFGNGVLSLIGDDCYLGDQNIAGSIVLQGNTGANTGIAMLPNVTASGDTLRLDWTGSDLYVTGGTTHTDIKLGGTGTVRLREIYDSASSIRGNIQIRDYSTQNPVVNIYGIGSVGEIDINNSSGERRASLYGTSSGYGVLQLRDASGNAATLTYPRLYNLISLSEGISYETSSQTTYNFSVSRTDTTAYSHFLIFGGTDASSMFLYLGFVDTLANGNTATMVPVYNTSNVSLNASYSGTTLIITGSSTVWGGLRLVWLN